MLIGKKRKNKYKRTWDSRPILKCKRTKTFVLLNMNLNSLIVGFNQ
jgi:hypothetical protein